MKSIILVLFAIIAMLASTVSATGAFGHHTFNKWEARRRDHNQRKADRQQAKADKNQYKYDKHHGITN